MNKSAKAVCNFLIANKHDIDCVLMFRRSASIRQQWYVKTMYRYISEATAQQVITQLQLKQLPGYMLDRCYVGDFIYVLLENVHRY